MVTNLIWAPRNLGPKKFGLNLIFILQEWHINLFGEIVHDEPEQDQIIESSEEDLVILNERSSQAGRVFKNPEL